MKTPTIPSISLISKVKTSWGLIVKNHYLIFSVLMIVSLSVAVYVINLTMQLPSDDSYRDQQINTGSTIKFDKATIDKIKNLKRSDDQSPLPPPPSGTRLNPFAE